MQKKLGFLFGLFFIVVSIVNFIDTPTIFCLNSLGLFMIGIAFIESSYFGYFGKIGQVATMILFSMIATLENGANSLVPILAIFLAVLLSQRYFPKYKKLASYYTLAPLMTSLLSSDWKLVSIVNNSILYVILTSILYIILNDDI